jgi:hypothetical protein
MKKVLLTLVLCALCASQVMAQEACKKAARAKALAGGTNVEAELNAMRCK